MPILTTSAAIVFSLVSNDTFLSSMTSHNRFVPNVSIRVIVWYPEVVDTAVTPARRRSLSAVATALRPSGVYADVGRTRIMSAASPASSFASCLILATIAAAEEACNPAMSIPRAISRCPAMYVEMLVMSLISTATVVMSTNHANGTIRGARVPRDV